MKRLRFFIPWLAILTALACSSDEEPSAPQQPQADLVVTVEGASAGAVGPRNHHDRSGNRRRRLAGEMCDDR